MKHLWSGEERASKRVAMNSRNKGNIIVYRLEPAYFLLECYRSRSIVKNSNTNHLRQ